MGTARLDIRGTQGVNPTVGDESGLRARRRYNTLKVEGVKKEKLLFDISDGIFSSLFSGVWPDDKEANKALRGHVKYWEEPIEKRTMVMGGDFWDNAAIIIFEAPSLEEAEKIVRADPAVKAYVFKAQVRPIKVHSMSKKYFID